MTKNQPKSNCLNLTSSQEITELASQCVKCGLCLQHCPTYQLTQNENESPRGRIAIIQAVAEGKLPLGQATESHLDNCLTCRSCEPVCPAHVQYGELITKGRGFIKNGHFKEAKMHAAFTSRFLKYIVRSPFRIRFTGKLLRILEITKLRSLARMLGITSLLRLNQLDATLPKVLSQTPFAKTYPALNAKQGEVALFMGCFSTWCDRETLEASIFVLQKMGYTIHVPPLQHCCGAMALHSGNSKEAFQLAQKNLDAFQNKNFNYILSTASGCGLDLKEYPKYFSSPSNPQLNADLKQFSNKVLDISEFVANCQWPENLTFSPLPLSVLLHSPCTLKNGLKADDFSKKILQKIPNLKWKPLTTTENCCGAAGTYMLDNPKTATALAEKMLSKLGDIPADFIATSNIGCGLHLKKELQSQKRAIKVIHPITLLAKSLGF